MAKKDTKKQKLQKPIPRKQKSGGDLFDVLNNFLSKRSNIIFWILFTTIALISLLLFDVKASIGGDDSSYILSAYNFVHDFTYPGGWEGALYPIFLSPFIWLFGISLPLLKSLSLVCMLIFFGLFYLEYKKHIPPFVLFFSMLILSVNTHLLYFASQTYTEAFFMMIQAVLFLVINKYFISNEKENIEVKRDYKKFLLLGFVLFIVCITKNIGLASIIAVLAYFVITKHWKSFLFTALSAALFMLPFEMLKRNIWTQSGLQIKSQGSGLLYKDFYNHARGYEDFSGFIQRVIDNSNLYLSKHLYILLGLKSELSISPVLTIITYIVFLIALIAIFKRNKYLLFAGTYVGTMCLISFIVLQKMWDSERLIIVYLPYILVFLFGGVYYILSKEKLKKLQFLLLLLMVFLFFGSMKVTTPLINSQSKILRKNIAGDMLYGFREDWINFIKVSQWANEHVPKDKKIASRKPDISFIYTGRKFYPIYKVPSFSSDSLMEIIDTDTQSVYITVLAKDIFQKKGLETIFYGYGSYVHSAVAVEGVLNDISKPGYEYIVYRFPKNKSQSLLKILSDNHLPYNPSVNKMIQEYKNKNYAMLVHDPDVLLKTLKRDSVRYVIMANMSFSKTLTAKEPKITTINRFIHFIEIKYPILQVVYKVGNKEEDSARLLEIHYERLNTKVVKF